MNSIRHELTRIPKIEMETVADRTAAENFDQDPSLEKSPHTSSRTTGISTVEAAFNS